jgi:hypothetical protein
VGGVGPVLAARLEQSLVTKARQQRIEQDRAEGIVNGMGVRQL